MGVFVCVYLDAALTPNCNAIKNCNSNEGQPPQRAKGVKAKQEKERNEKNAKKETNVTRARAEGRMEWTCLQSAMIAIRAQSVRYADEEQQQATQFGH